MGAGKTIVLKDGSTERKFLIKSMGAYQAESWMYRAALAIGRNVNDVAGLFGGSKLAVIQTLFRINYTEAKPLLDELLECVYLVNGDGMVQLSESNVSMIEVPTTLMRLRIEAFKQNFGFFTSGSEFSSLLGLPTEPTAQA